MAVCPCCGSEVAGNKLLVSLDTNLVFYGGRIYSTYSPMVTEFLYALHQKWPAIVRDTDLHIALWGFSKSEIYYRNIITYACLARKTMRALGGDIKRMPGRGYRMVMPKDAAC